ncbi:hypothetical protein EHS13_01915 [Paenibacillus psychroresistens]|uniref:Uncharacterized protein n=1 Tax=Paenibacillus psychroresistens TaxID=1778678 RepID=A0A6B8RBA1_9BACL|nr:hypothetical protein [Paenibacillus psychroresistens]QGQ93749.1 hypothetical protein EHS13_01915 [Paenibacillus psychroresistens]
MNTNRLSTMLYGLSLIITIAVFLLLSSWGDDMGFWLVSLLAVLFAESMGYWFFGYVIKRNSRRESVPAFVPFMTLTVFYGAAVIFHLCLFWLVLQISFTSYLVIHLITFAIWAIGMGMVHYFTDYVRDQAENAAVQTQLITQLQAVLLSIKHNLEPSKQAEREALKSELKQLMEQVKYSDPVSNASMMNVEENLLWQINSLDQCVQMLAKDEGDIGNVELSRKLIADISKDLIKRNSQLKELK